MAQKLTLMIALAPFCRMMAAANDSIASLDYGIMESIEQNTRKEFFWDNWHLYGILSIAIALITWYQQKKTADHTTNAPIEVQKWILRDLPRHFYRNLVCTCAIILKFRSEGEERRRTRYPSESNLKKLKTLPEQITIPIDVDKNKNSEHNVYKYMHEIKLLLRNYNTEVEVASNHLARKTISDDSLKQDFDNLLFKPLFLVYSTFEFERALSQMKNRNWFEKFFSDSKDEQESFVANTISTILWEHFRKIKVESNFNVLLKDEAKPVISILDNKHEDVFANFKNTIDENDSIDRAVKILCSKVSDELRFHNINEKEFAEKYGIAYDNDKKSLTINKDKIIAYAINNEPPKTKNNLKTYVEAILNISNETQFKSFYKRFYNADNDKLEDLYKKLTPYFNYLKGNNWELHKLLKYILVVDTVIEIDRIGMVNYE